LICVDIAKFQAKFYLLLH